MFHIDPMSRQPVYEQLIEQVEKYILAGILSPGDQIPSVRSLSVSLSVNPNTIQKAYSQLDAKKLIYSVPGKGCFVSNEASELLSFEKRKKLEEFEALVQELLLAGVTKEELITCIEKYL